MTLIIMHMATIVRLIWLGILMVRHCTSNDMCNMSTFISLTHRSIADHMHAAGLEAPHNQITCGLKGVYTTQHEQ